MPENLDKIRISLDDIERVVLEPQAPPPVTAEAPGTSRQWGSIAGVGAPASLGADATPQGGSFFMKGWVYLGLAGLVGAFGAWAICEPTFVDGDPTDSRWATTSFFR